MAFSKCGMYFEETASPLCLVVTLLWYTVWTGFCYPPLTPQKMSCVIWMTADTYASPFLTAWADKVDSITRYLWQCLFQFSELPVSSQI